MSILGELATACIAGRDEKSCVKLHVLAWEIPTIEKELSHVIGERLIILPWPEPGPERLQLMAKFMDQRDLLTALRSSRAGDPSPQPSLWSHGTRVRALEQLHQGLTNAVANIEGEIKELRSLTK